MARWRAWYLRVRAYSYSPHVRIKKERHEVIQVTMNVGQKFTIQLSVVPPFGVIDAPPTYQTVLGNVVSIVPAADGLSAVVTAIAPTPPGAVETITEKALSLGNPISGDDSVQVTVLPVPATSLHVTIGPIT